MLTEMVLRTTWKCHLRILISSTCQTSTGLQLNTSITLDMETFQEKEINSSTINNLNQPTTMISFPKTGTDSVTTEKNKKHILKVCYLSDRIVKSNNKSI